MELQISNVNGVYNFKDNNILYQPRVGGLKRRVSMEKRFGKSGAVAVGDRQIDTRDFKINFNNVAQTDSPYIDILANIVTMFDPNLTPIYIEDIGPLQRRALVELDGLNDQPVAAGNFYRIGDNNIDMTMLDGVWEDLFINIVTSPSGGLTNQDTMNVLNDASIVTYPVITITPLADNSEFTLTNTTTDELITLGSAGFVVGTTFTINSITGDIFLDDGITRVELSSAMADGSGFLSLAPGVNTFLYESIFGDVDVTFEFRRRYPF